MPSGGNACQLDVSDATGGADTTVAGGDDPTEGAPAEGSSVTSDTFAPTQIDADSTVPMEVGEVGDEPMRQWADSSAFCSGASVCAADSGCSARLVLFGGRSQGANGPIVLGDTWEFDGSQWTQDDVDAASLPAARFVAGLGSVCGQALLFGGTDGNGVTFPDAWRWDGSLWSALQGTSGTPPFGSVTMTSVVSTGGKVWAFGGIGANFLLAQSNWIFDGSSWQRWEIAAAPSQRAGAAIAASLNGQLVLFGGRDAAGNPLDDTWTWNGTEWTQYLGAIHPSARVQPSAAGTNGNVVLFGGYGMDDAGTASILGDTWVWDGIGWTEEVTTNPPPPRFEAAVATLKDQAVIFGGIGAGPNNARVPLDDTCTWNGSSWVCIRLPGPGARYGAAMTNLQ